MDLLSRLTEDMKAAMKSGQKDRLGVIRMLISEVKIIDMQPSKPTAEQAVESYAKKLRKSLEEYEKLGKTAEVDKLKFEIGVADEYLPKKASAEETERLVDAFLAANAFTEKQAGQATGAFMKAHAGQVDPALVNPLVRKKLAGK
ncbi:GatB/YqeY domain-containing protein [Humisphaera borealis]|uniref:GatB/YqeY domain-containing protein n=1 Tax=Humisphaera borealis TaxID=2807512 RepID=A0A7M2WU50_9BACT|nr:GatB/YqeY domain-containing protein [Humisphaera borealis]QOV88692.1 GatB/YqeY domain-containing protein [Humisphaera borealis]